MKFLKLFMTNENHTLTRRGDKLSSFWKEHTHSMWPNTARCLGRLLLAKKLFITFWFKKLRCVINGEVDFWSY